MSTNSIFDQEFSSILSHYVGYQEPQSIQPTTYGKTTLIQLIENNDFETIKKYIHSNTIERSYDNKGKSLTDYMIMNYKMSPMLKLDVFRAAAWRNRRHAVYARELNDRLA
jgi:hypothetical protein